MKKIRGPQIVKRAHLTHYAFSVPHPRQALARDGFRCMVTGSFDTKFLGSNRELERRCSDLGGMSAAVRACHILVLYPCVLNHGPEFVSGHTHSVPPDAVGINSSSTLRVSDSQTHLWNLWNYKPSSAVLREVVELVTR